MLEPMVINLHYMALAAAVVVHLTVVYNTGFELARFLSISPFPFFKEGFIHLS